MTGACCASVWKEKAEEPSKKWSLCALDWSVHEDRILFLWATGGDLDSIDSTYCVMPGGWIVRIVVCEFSLRDWDL